MIGFLRGRVLEKQPNRVLVDVNGVGYEVFIPLSTFYDVGDEGAEIALRIHTHVREDSLQLFGFLTLLERQMFERLITVSGIGPKLAIAVLSGGPPRELLSAVASGDTARLQAVPGIGKRTAERIIVELREKVAGRVADEIVVRRTASDDPRTLAREGLLGLGFSPQEADGLLDSAAGDTPEDLIAEALRAAR